MKPYEVSKFQAVLLQLLRHIDEWEIEVDQSVSRYELSCDNPTHENITLHYSLSIDDILIAVIDHLSLHTEEE